MNIFLILGFTFLIIGLFLSLQNSRKNEFVHNKKNPTVDVHVFSDEKDVIKEELRGLTPTEVYVKYKTHLESANGFNEYTAITLLYTTDARALSYSEEIEKINQTESTFIKKYVFPLVLKLFPRVDSVKVVDEVIDGDFATVYLKQGKFAGNSQGTVTFKKENEVWRIIDESWNNIRNQ